jgi:hypothetical protein
MVGRKTEQSVEHTRSGLEQFEAYAWLCTHVSGLAQLIMSSYGVEDRSSLHEAYHTLVLDSYITTSLDFVAIVSFPLILWLPCTLLTAASAQVKSGMQHEHFTLLQFVLGWMALAMNIFTTSWTWTLVLMVVGHGWPSRLLEHQAGKEHHGSNIRHGTLWNGNQAWNLQGTGWQGISRLDQHQ